MTIPTKPRNSEPSQDIHSKMKLSNNDLLSKLKIDSVQPTRPNLIQDEPDDPLFDLKKEDKNGISNNHTENTYEPVIQAKPKRDELGMLTKQKKALVLKSMPI